MADANIRAVITADDRASAVLQKFGNQTTATAEKSTTSFRNSWLAVTAATAGIVAFGKKSLDAFNEQDLAITRLQAGINNVKSATDKHIDALIKQAGALQKTTRFSDEAYISAQGILSTFQLNQKAIAKLTPRLADMSEGLARVTGQMPDLEGNAILVAKALGGEDVVGLVGALRRVGVVMTQTQTDMLQTGTQEQRLAVITQVLDQNFKGMAEAAGGTTAGKMAELKNQFNDLQEKVGQTIATAITPFLNAMNAHPAILAIATGALAALAVAFVSVKVAAAIGSVINGVTVALGAMSTAASTATTALSTLSAVSIAGWAALIVGDLLLVKSALNSVKGAANATYDAINAASNLAPEGQMRQLQKQAAVARAAGDTAAAARYANAIAALAGGRAEGGPVSFGKSYIVGERGPELFMPSQSGTIIPNNQISGGNNIVVNIGMYAGSEMEKRKIATQLMRAFNDAQAAKGMA